MDDSANLVGHIRERQAIPDAGRDLTRPAGRRGAMGRGVALSRLGRGRVTNAFHQAVAVLRELAFQVGRREGRRVRGHPELGRERPARARGKREAEQKEQRERGARSHAGRDCKGRNVNCLPDGTGQMSGGRGTAAAAVAAGAALALFLAGGAGASGAKFRPAEVPGEGFVLMPEAERTFARVVLGLHPHGTLRMSSGRDAAGPRVVEVRRRLYGLDFELLHGGCMTRAVLRDVLRPVPDPAAIPEASGEEEGDFRAYLASRLGWSAETIGARVRFFRVTHPLQYPQDMAEILGLDSAGRLVLGVGADTAPVYSEPVERLQRAFPGDFSVRRLAGVRVGDVNTEGGDLALSWLPDGKVGLLAGRHRVIRYLERRTGERFLGRPLTAAQIDEARRAFSSAFFGVEVVVLGEGALRDPMLGSEELFHADMVVAAVRNDREVIAFVPTYEARPRDANSGVLFTEAFTRDVQREYDLVAGQMRDRGYRVVRIPFEDHPVRGPANVSKFVDRSSGKPFVLLGRYPEHRPVGPNMPSPMQRLREAILRLQTGVDAWEAKPDGRRWAALQARFAEAWKELDAAAASPNPLFERQRVLYESNGVGVKPVVLFPTGEGGIHCLLLR